MLSRLGYPRDDDVMEHVRAFQMFKNFSKPQKDIKKVLFNRTTGESGVE